MQLQRSTVRLQCMIFSTVSSVLSAAVDDGMLAKESMPRRLGAHVREALAPHLAAFPLQAVTLPDGAASGRTPPASGWC